MERSLGPLFFVQVRVVSDLAAVAQGSKRHSCTWPVGRPESEPANGGLSFFNYHSSNLGFTHSRTPSDYFGRIFPGFFSFALIQFTDMAPPRRSVSGAEFKWISFAGAIHSTTITTLQGKGLDL